MKLAEVRKEVQCPICLGIYTCCHFDYRMDSIFLYMCHFVSHADMTDEKSDSLICRHYPEDKNGYGMFAPILQGLH